MEGTSIGYVVTFLCSFILLLLLIIFKRIDNIDSKVDIINNKTAEQNIELAKRPTWSDCNERMNNLRKDFKDTSCSL